jgi:N-acetylmuramoyl-L-alanine amidase
MTRDIDKAFGNDISTDSVNRTNIVKKSAVDLCLSIHFNAGGGTGCETVYQLNVGQPVINLANNILDSIAALGIKKRKAYSKESIKNKGTDYYFMLRMTRPVTSLIVECAFIDNAEDRKKFNTDDGLWLIAKAISDAVANYFGVQEDKPMNTEFDENIKTLKDNSIIDADSNHDPDEPVTWQALSKVAAKLLTK